MNTKFNKILLSATLAASLGAVAIAPIGGGHAYAATNDQSNADKRKDKAERLADNADFLAAQAAQFQAMFPTEENSTATTQEPAKSEAPAANTMNKTITVVVPQGANLTQLAAQYGVTVDELVAANNLLPVGFNLTIPQK